MGAYSPSVFLDVPTRTQILDTIVRPTIRGMAAAGHAYRGVLYVGLMLTESGPRVLEFNARFGDPETQVLMPRLDGDWLHVLRDCATGELGASGLKWRSDAAVCVVMASPGYPEHHRTGHPIHGLDEAEALEGVLVFHAGTALDAGGRHVTAGGRVLGVTGVGRDLAAARGRAYEAVARIRWDGEQHRGDIALDALAIAAGRDGS
jgi:phosphoribosylamine--glycine ligase